MSYSASVRDLRRGPPHDHTGREPGAIVRRKDLAAKVVLHPDKDPFETIAEFAGQWIERIMVGLAITESCRVSRAPDAALAGHSFARGNLRSVFGVCGMIRAGAWSRCERFDTEVSERGVT